jgi:type II secretory pathway pseudopilin PulG
MIKFKIRPIKNQKGTSLIEILVSIFIVLLIFQMTYIIVLSSSLSVKARNNTNANVFAVSLIEVIRTEEIENGFYQADDSFMGITLPEGMGAEILVSNIENRPFLRAVKVTVYFMEENQSHQLEIHSLIRRDL